jgi:segregation and condensation protein B
MTDIKILIEALIFASEFPISHSQLAEIIEGVEKDRIRQAIMELIEEYDKRNAGIHIVEVGGGYQFRTRSEASPWLKKLFKGKITAMSIAAMETLAVVAYKQPVLKSEIDSIRGVDAGGALKSLIERKLVRILGRKDVPGKPIIYGTSKKFLEVFNLKDLSELPTLKEFSDLENK